MGEYNEYHRENSLNDDCETLDGRDTWEEANKEFNHMTLLEIFTWLRNNDGWSKDWFDNELYPIIMTMTTKKMYIK